ncbi:cell division protease FtsH [Pelomonas saccharophila]|uniref:Cell division protease FtsH n=1 Tax=Roseateles saccharophilus TaxID=304 RepID=A0ABU1YIF1_ROSSA|nr:AAA family ATPase [Roseateles saccharophilus]MDR7268624.1 cell division protease FtsH [Roseateles saccharophilus]
MDSASNTPSPGLRQKLIIAASAAALLLAGLGLSTLHERTASEMQARKNATALAFEKAPEQWLAHPREASEFERALQAKDVAAVGVSGGLVLYTDRSGKFFSTRLIDCGLGCKNEIGSRLGELSVAQGFALTDIDVDARTSGQRLFQSLERAANVLGPILLLLLVAAPLIYLQMRGGLGQRTRLAEKPRTRFDDVIGADEAKKALRRVAAFMKDPKQYAAVGAKAPRGVLLDGPPGTGKTLLAKALAGECGASFISVDGSYFSSMFYGAGIGKVKELFKKARESAPCIIFIDEIDGIGKRSNGKEAGGGGGEQEQNRIINRLLVEMDGFAALENVVVVGATNHVDNVDEAMRRPGRFDLIVRTALPTVPEREQLFGLYLGQTKSAPGIDVASIARTAAGMSPADIANCVNRAAAYAAEAGEALVSQERVYQSLETHQLGGEVSNTKNLITPETLRRIAFHESGHALVAHVLEAGSVERVSIEPRGPALGVTYVARANEEPLYGERELRGRLAMMLAGREAELIAFGNASSGAADDLKRASELATNMVGSLGFGKTFGLLSMAGVPRELIGPDVQKSVLDEARALLESAQAECRRVLEEKRDRLDRLTEMLLGQETVSGAPLKRVLAGDTV